MTTIKIYRNKRNSNKYIEVHNDGYYHNSIRQFMQWDNLAGICWNCMRSEMKSHFKMETAKKRQPAEIIMAKVSSAEDEVIALEILKSVMENLTIRQQNIITLKMLGYSNIEICLMMEMSKSSYYRELENIRQMIVDGNF